MLRQVWDHFFHGETYDGSLDPDWSGTAPNAEWSPAINIVPVPTAPTGMQVIDQNGEAIAIGSLKPTLTPPLRVTGVFAATSVTVAAANDIGGGKVHVFDFGQNMAGMTKLVSIVRSSWCWE